MLSERQLEALLALFEERMQGVTAEYLTAMGEHLKAIGKLTPSDVHRLTEMKRVGLNARRIQRAIAKAANISVADLDRVFRATAESDVRFAQQWFAEDYTPAVKGLPKLSKPIERVLKAQLRLSAQAFKNLSQTTIETQRYRDAVDVAITSVQAGVTDYNSAIRRTMKAAAQDGLRVKYPNSDMTRRLDSAVRQNVLDGVRAVNNDVLRQLGNEYGADGVEISAHALCATDHLPYQGLQFSNREFEELQNSLDRPFGMWNCKHTIFPIILGVSEPTHDADELRMYRENSNAEIDIGGRKMTRYEWTQEQRRIETAARAQKDIAIAAKASGDDFARREAQAHINDLQTRYDKISKAAGLDAQHERMGVAGFRAVKTIEQLKKPPQNDKMPVSTTKAGGNNVNFICKIDRNIYSCVTDDITTDEVVITSKQMAHIFEGHPEKEHANVIERLSEAVQTPDYIIADSDPRTAVVLKMFTSENDERYRIIMKLAGNDPEHPKNSIITAFYISEKKWNKYLRNKIILYKRNGL